MSIVKSTYHSPLGEILLAVEEGRLTGLWFYNQRHFGSTLRSDEPHSESPKMKLTGDVEVQSPIISATIDWLDRYFSGENPGAPPPIEMRGTDFQRRVWEHLTTIPRGTTTTYGRIASRLCSSPRAVGNAVGRNPLLLMVPCHRVTAADGSLGGYAAGESIKRALLELESH